MADQFLITPYKVRSAGTDVPPEEVQAAINSLAQQVTVALNSVASDPTGPAGGDLGATYPNPTVVSLHVTGGTESGVAVTGNTINNSPIGATTPNTGAFTTATAGSLFASGGAVPAVTATGTQVYNSPNPTVQFIDSIRSAGNKNAFITWGSTVLAFGFANDAFTSFTNALSITGGQVSGISGITSSSGTGAWAHTGGFSASGGINSTAIGATTASTGAFTTLTSTGGAFNGTVGATTPSTGSFTTLAASGAVSGAGFTARFASPGPIGNTAASTGAFTTLTASTAIGVASGGTGAATLTAHGVLLGEGTSPIAATAVGTTGQMLIGVTGADPAFGNTVSTLTATGAITPSSTAGIVGTTTNDNANAGSVGELLTANTTNTAASAGVPLNATSISLTAGDWEVTGIAQFQPAATTAVNSVLCGISTTSATFGTVAPGINNYALISATLATGTNMQNMVAPVTRVSLSTTTTVFLVAQIGFTVSTATVSGFIRARRVR